jgi:hypothetical protein
MGGKLTLAVQHTPNGTAESRLGHCKARASYA